MQVWRIAKKRFALDRTGGGGLIEAGRWHQAGQPVIYVGLSIEIAVLEKRVHTGPFLPADLVLVELTLPDEPALYEQPNLTSLPSTWMASPSGDASADFGAAFLRSGRAMGLIVPSAVVPEAHNMVINPMHPRFADVRMEILRKFEFDHRLA